MTYCKPNEQIEAIPKIKTENLFSQVLPEPLTDSSSKLNDKEVFNGLIKYLENNIFHKQKSEPDQKETLNMDVLKSHIEKFIETSKDKIDHPNPTNNKIVESFGTHFHIENKNKDNILKIEENQIFEKQHRKIPQSENFQRHNDDPQYIEHKQFMSLEKKFNELIKLNEATQTELIELKKNKSFTTIKSDFGKHSQNHKSELEYEQLNKKDDFFKKLHQASFEMEVNRDSQLFSTQSKPKIDKESKTKKSNSVSESFHLEIENIYEKSKEIEKSDLIKLKNENINLMKKINTLKSNLNKFQENCESFNDKSDKELKLLHKIEELEERLKDKEYNIIDLKSKNLDLAKEVYQKKEYKKLEDKCSQLQEQLHGNLIIHRMFRTATTI